MKIYAYEVRQDEMGYFKEYEKKYGVSVVFKSPSTHFRKCR